MNIDQINGFKNYLTVSGLKDDYVNPVLLFLKFCDSKNIDCKQITYDQVSEYILYSKVRNRVNGTKVLSDGYINNLLKAMRKFYQYLVVSQNLDPCLLETVRKFKLLKVEQKLKPKITKEEFKEMMAGAISHLKRYEYNKLKAVFYFLFYTGIRAGEFVNLHRSDIDLEKCRALIKTPNKSRQERIVIFPSEVSTLLRKYFSVEEESSNAFNMNYTQLSYMCKKVSQYLNVSRPITVHDLRHAFAHMLADNDIGIRVAQKLLGHRSLDTTQVYYDPDLSMMEKIYRKNLDPENVDKKEIQK